MKRVHTPVDKAQQTENEYQRPAIVYEGQISTRAGSTTGGGLLPDPDKDIDLFGDPEK